MTEALFDPVENQSFYEPWFEEQFEDRFEWTSPDGTEISLIDIQHPDYPFEDIDSTPILLLQGFLSNTVAEKATIHHFASKPRPRDSLWYSKGGGRRVIALDFTNLEKTFSNGSSQETVLDEKVTVLNSVVDALRIEKLHAVAHSAGTIVFAKAADRRDDEIFDKFIAVSPAGLLRFYPTDIARAGRTLFRSVRDLVRHPNTENIWEASRELIQPNLKQTAAEMVLIPGSRINNELERLAGQMSIGMVIEHSDQLFRHRHYEKYFKNLEKSEQDYGPFEFFAVVNNKKAGHAGILHDPISMDAALYALDNLPSKEN